MSKEVLGDNSLDGAKLNVPSGVGDKINQPLQDFLSQQRALGQKGGGLPPEMQKLPAGNEMVRNGFDLQKVPSSFMEKVDFNIWGNGDITLNIKDKNLSFHSDSKNIHGDLSNPVIVKNLVEIRDNGNGTYSLIKSDGDHTLDIRFGPRKMTQNAPQVPINQPQSQQQPNIAPQQQGQLRHSYEAVSSIFIDPVSVGKFNAEYGGKGIVFNRNGLTLPNGNIAIPSNAKDVQIQVNSRFGDDNISSQSSLVSFYYPNGLKQIFTIQVNRINGGETTSVHGPDGKNIYSNFVYLAKQNSPTFPNKR